MSDQEPKPKVRIELPPARPYSAEETKALEEALHRADYHSAPRKEFDTVNQTRTSFILSDTVSYEYRDGRGNVATTSLNTFNRDSSTSLVCKDGRRLSEAEASRAVAAVQKGEKDDGWFSTDYIFDRELNPLEKACRTDHNNKKHGGREY